DKVQHWDEVQETLKQLSEEAAPSPESAEPQPKNSATPEAEQSPESETEVAAEEDSVDAALEASLPEEEAFPHIGIAEYSSRLEAEGEGGENQIALLYAEGTIISGEGGLGVIGSDEYVSVLQELRQDEEVKAVVLRINSPGGSATASHLIEREVALLQAVKPVIVSMGDMAASGGYMIAAPAQTIVAEANTITGSIGVYGLLPNAQKLANDNGVTWDSVTTGPYANLYTIARPRSASEMALLQKFVDQFYTDFINLVAEGRNLPASKVNEIAQGRVWSGLAAQKVNLVDELGGLQTAIDRAAAAANLAEGDWYIAEYPYIPTFEEEIIDRLFGDLELSLLSPQRLLQGWFSQDDPSRKLSPPVAEMVENMQADWETLLEFSDPRQIYMRLPYRLEID
ncbi:MAG: signal peptide peptidase SppA, partial [Prochlorotrichaceae cyanobacterium]